MADPVRDYGLDADGDLATVNGDYVLIAGEAACLQLVQIAILTYLKEIYLDESLGVDYINQILIKNADPLVVRALVQAAIASVTDVTAVVGANLVGPDANREATIRYRIRTVYSTQTVDGAVSFTP